MNLVRRLETAHLEIISKSCLADSSQMSFSRQSYALACVIFFEVSRCPACNVTQYKLNPYYREASDPEAQWIDASQFHVK